MVNVMGDALATGIMAHICRKDFVKEGEQVRTWADETLSIFCRNEPASEDICDSTGGNI